MPFLQPDAVFDGRDLYSDRVIEVENGVVQCLLAANDLPSDAAVAPLKGIVTPGLFDTQVNGGGGVMFNNDPTPDGVRAIAEAHRKAGTRFILPTVITDAPEVLVRAADAALQTVGRDGVLGIHIEGPHINPAHKGTHNPAFIRPVDQTTWDQVEKLRNHNVPILLTLAPETVPSGTITRLNRMGVVVAAGHTAATAAQFHDAIDEGLRAVTHLFNGMPAMTARSPMLTGAAINSDIWCGIIADGHHVDPQMLSVAMRARPKPDRMVLVSDAMSTMGGPDSFELYGEAIRVQGGRLINANGSLAGAHLCLADAVRNVMRLSPASPAEILKMGVTNPLSMMRLEQPSIEGASIKDVV